MIILSQVVSEDGSPLIVLAAFSEDEAADWIFRLCQAVAEMVGHITNLFNRKSIYLCFLFRFAVMLGIFPFLDIMKEPVFMYLFVDSYFWVQSYDPYGPERFLITNHMRMKVLYRGHAKECTLKGIYC